MGQGSTIQHCIGGVAFPLHFLILYPSLILDSGFFKFLNFFSKQFFKNTLQFVSPIDLPRTLHNNTENSIYQLK